VFGTSKLTRTTMGYRVLIQSERSTEYLEHRIDNFFNCLETIIVEMGDKEYKGHVEALIARKLEKKRSLTEEGDRYWSRIRDGYYNFLQHESESDIAKTVTKEEVLEFLRHYISPSSKYRSKLVVHLKSQVKKDDRVTGYPDGKPITDVGVFRSQLSLTEAPTPSKDLSSYMEPEPKL
jgi:insulysin